MAASDTYVIACTSRWFWDIWEQEPTPEGDWHYVRYVGDLSADALASLAPRFVFFPHWSERVPDEIWQAHECVVFHAAPVPYGRGGSPIQNMVLAGHDETEVVALRMEHDLDAGPVYLRRRVSLLGGGDEVFTRVFREANGMLRDLVAVEPEPVAQAGPVHRFKRRTPEQSALPQTSDLEAVFDHIRILDVEGYPRAYVDHGPLRIELRRAAKRSGEIQVDAVITVRDDEGVR